MKRPLYGFLLCYLMLWSGCIGTDLVDDPLPMMDARLEITPSDAALQAGETIQFAAEYFDTFGDNVANAQIVWTSSAPDIVTVGADGIATAQQTGQSMITATADGVSSLPALLTVVADPNQVAGVTITPSSLQLEIGGMQSFTAAVVNLNGDPIEDVAISWTHSNLDVASLTPEGLLTALQPGTTMLVATADNVSSLPVIVTVRAPVSQRQGDFTGNRSYTVEGTATLREAVDGGLELVLESNFSSSQGPNLGVFLSTSNRFNATSINLGTLQANSGEQTYSVPSDVTLESFDYVLIHCIPFNITFGAAELQ